MLLKKKKKEAIRISNLLLFTNQRDVIWIVGSSHVAALRFSCQNQLIPQTNHLSRRLVMCRQVILYATKLTKLEAVNVVHRFGPVVELFYPHSHTHIFHFEHLQYQKKNSYINIQILCLEMIRCDVPLVYVSQTLLQ